MRIAPTTAVPAYDRRAGPGAGTPLPTGSAVEASPTLCTRSASSANAARQHVDRRPDPRGDAEHDEAEQPPAGAEPRAQDRRVDAPVHMPVRIAAPVGHPTNFTNIRRAMSGHSIFRLPPPTNEPV